jgi:hypothetical protein
MKVGKIKKITMYRMDLDEVSSDEKKVIVDYGRQVITDDQYFEIGAVKALENYIEIGKKEPKKKNKRKRISKYL